ncbi:MAG: fructose-1,6-bisphosphatase, partial [Oscillospiraceae bacterium]|nr:fructose-1,6-bisphosphatase [Oscillospiraceae bacterium]
MTEQELSYARLLSERYPNIAASVRAIVDMSATLRLPKGTEYFFSDLHGEHAAFIQLLRSASGVIRDKIDTVYADTLPEEVRDELGMLITHPHTIRRRKRAELSPEDYDEWSAVTIHRLIQVSREVASKYGGDRVSPVIDEKFYNIIDALLLNDDRVVNKVAYYKELIDGSIRCGIGDDLIEAICAMLQQIAVDQLHILGDIFDRGPRADLIMDELMRHRSVDIQWGNHDMDWIGAVAGNRVCMFSVLRKAISYNNFDCLEDGYGINLRPLSNFADRVYAGDPCKAFQPHLLDLNQYDPVDTALAARMHKAVAVIMFKLEGQLIARNPDYGLEDRLLLDKLHLDRGTITVGGREYALTDTNFPTVDPADPYALTPGEQEIADTISASFQHGERLRRHIDYLVTNGAMYKCYNGNLLFHGCIPMLDDGSFAGLDVGGTVYTGKALLDALDRRVRWAYYNRESANTDFFWYLWAGASSPLFGKTKMTTFERYFTAEPELRKEPQNAYFQLSRQEEVAKAILTEFGLDPETGHILNGHMPVKVGDSPIRANGRLYVIDGGIAKSYHPTTGIAGYTLIFNSTVIKLAEHRPVMDENGIQVATRTVTRVVETMPRQLRVAYTDLGLAYQERIAALTNLIRLY